MKRPRSLAKLLVALVGASALAAALLVAPGIPHVFATGSPNWGPYFNASVAPYTATCSATPTDQSATINTAISDASGYQGGSTVVFSPCPVGQQIGLSSSISLKSNVTLKLGGTYLKWIGAANGDMLVNGDNGGNFVIDGGEAYFDCNNVSGVNGIHFNTFGDGQVKDVYVTKCNYGLYLQSTVSGRNFVNTKFDKIAGTYNNVMLVTSATGGTGGVVTDNYFYHLNCWKCHQGFIDLRDHSDNNYFFGGWGEQDSDNAFGVRLGNSCIVAAGGDTDCGVQSNYMTSIATEFESHVGTSCLYFGPSRGDTFLHFWCPEGNFGSPAATRLITDVGGANTSYYITRFDDNHCCGSTKAGGEYVLLKNINTGYGSESLQVDSWPNSFAHTAGYTVATSCAAPGFYGERYQFYYRVSTTPTWTLVQNYSAGQIWNWNTTGAPAGTYYVRCNMKDVSSPNSFDLQAQSTVTLT